MAFLLANWRIIAFLIITGGVFIAGWHANTIWQAYHAQKIEFKEIDSLGRGETSIIDFNQKISKDLNEDDCLNRPMPVSIVRLLK